MHDAHCAILRNLGEVARTYLCLDRERRVREGTRPAISTGFSNLHSVGRIRMRPVTNRGLRRTRPPRTRTTLTRKSSVAFAESFNRYRREIYEAFDMTVPVPLADVRGIQPQSIYQRGSATPPRRKSPSAFSGRIGIARGEGPCTADGPTYVRPFL